MPIVNAVAVARYKAVSTSGKSVHFYLSQGISEDVAFYYGIGLAYNSGRRGSILIYRWDPVVNEWKVVLPL